jgi:hypothetical protein
MRKRSKKKRSMHSMRDSNGRFCKALRESPAKGPIAQTPPVGIEGVEKGEGREAASQRTDYAIYTGQKCFYYHKQLEYPVIIKEYDHFTHYVFMGLTYYDIRRQF